MPPWIYNPEPYTYSGLTFDELPDGARKYLNDCHLAPPTEYNAEVIQNRRKLRARELFRTLEGVNIALVEKFRELRYLAKREATLPTQEEHQSIAQRREEIVLEVLYILFPERRAHLDHFMIEFDALVWLDVRAREGTPDEATLEEQHAYRDGCCEPILKYTLDALVALNDAVAERDLLASGWGSGCAGVDRKIKEIETQPEKGVM